MMDQKSKEHISRILAIVLTFALILTNMNLTAFAEEAQGTENNQKIITEVQEPDNQASDASKADERSEEVKALQSRIDALPTVNEFVAMADGTTVEDSTLNQAQIDVYNEAQAIAEEMDKLTDEEQGQLDTGKLEALFEYFNGMTAETATTISPGSTTTLNGSSNYIEKAGTYNINASTVSSSTSSSQLIIENTSASDNIIINIKGNVKINSSNAIIYVKSACNLTVNGNGYTIQQTGGSNIICNSSNATIYLKNGKFIGGNDPTIINTNGGSVYIQDGTYITGNQIIQNTGSNCYIQDGEIKASGSTQALFAGKVYMTGGTLSSSAKGDKDTMIAEGYAADNAEITGGTIKDNKYGIQLFTNAGNSPVIGGNVKFENNAYDIYLAANKLFTVRDDFANTMTVGVADSSSMDSNGHRQITTNGTSKEMLNHIFAADKGYAVGYENGHLYLYKHTHTWGYTANNNVVTAKCTVSSNPCSYHTSGLTLTLTAPDMTYTGSAYNKASVTNNITSVTGANAGSITYYRESTKLGSGPVNAGTYTAKVTIGTATATANFEIAKVDITPAVTLADWVYGNAASTPKVTGNSGNGTITYS